MVNYSGLDTHTETQADYVREPGDSNRLDRGDNDRVTWEILP